MFIIQYLLQNLTSKHQNDNLANPRRLKAQRSISCLAENRLVLELLRQLWLDILTLYLVLSRLGAPLTVGILLCLIYFILYILAKKVFVAAQAFLVVVSRGLCW